MVVDLRAVRLNRATQFHRQSDTDAEKAELLAARYIKLARDRPDIPLHTMALMVRHSEGKDHERTGSKPRRRAKR